MGSLRDLGPSSIHTTTGPTTTSCASVTDIDLALPVVVVVVPIVTVAFFVVKMRKF